MGQYINSNLSGPTNIWFDDEGALCGGLVGGSVKNLMLPVITWGYSSVVGHTEGVDFSGWKPPDRRWTKFFSEPV